MTAETGAPSRDVYFPGINGLRALAALTVVTGHVTNALGEFGLQGRFLPAAPAYAVTVFFALSGFLITFLLLRERTITGAIRLRAFYARRILRIWPLYFLYLGLCFLWAGDPNHRLAYYVFMVPNVALSFDAILPLAVHFWSLGVEEQFYAFWPVLIGRSRHPASSILWVAGLVTLMRLAVRVLYGGWSNAYGLMYVTRIDCMAIGGFGAWLYASQSDVCRRLTSRMWEAAAWIALGLIVSDRIPIPSLFVHPMVAAIAVVIIVNQISSPRPLAPLENRPFDRLGRISFGLYVYHPLVIAVCATWFAGSHLSGAVHYLLVYGSVILLTVGVAALSYRFFESPFLRLGARYAVVRTRSGMNR